MEKFDLLKEHKWMAQHPNELEKHSGKWIAVLDQKIALEGNSYIEVFKKMKEKFPEKMPLITYIFGEGEEQLIAVISVIK